ncbi:MAG: molybdopterin-dependent oxidoreductase [Chloroflexi bacterium]|nr:molybdopterin-dependent oxidoreductase [Chloroflexota bacterium]
MSLSVVGRSVQRVDAVAKVTGEAEYVGDIQLGHMLTGKVLGSPYAHARIVRIDTSRARRLPGVHAVVTFEDSPKVRWNAAGFPPARGAMLTEDQYILADKARFVGDAVAAVAAADDDTASEARELIDVEYEPLPAVFDLHEAMAQGAPLVHAAEKNISRYLPFSRGSPEDGFREADYVAEDTYVTPRSFPCSLEPCGASIAAFDQSGRLTVWSSTQMPHLVRGIIAKAMNVPIGRVRVIKPFVGGAFGSRLGTVNEPICALLAQKAGRPVKLQYTREETFLATQCRHPSIICLKTGVKKDGRITARQMTAYLDTGAYATHTPSFTRPFAGFFLGMYTCVNARYDVYAVYTNSPPCGAYRGYGNPQVVFAVESQVDDIARAIGVDPLEMRLKNHPCKGEPGPHGWPIESCGLEEAIQRGAASIGWNEKRGGREGSGPTKRRGVGMAYMMHSSGTLPGLPETAGAIVKLNEDGTANLVFSSSDAGQGSATMLTQVAAEELGVRFEDVMITLVTDTDIMPFDVGSHASRSTYCSGNAVREAAAHARRQLLAQAGEMLEVSPEDLEVREGCIRVKGSADMYLTVGMVSREAQYGRGGHQIIGVASQEPPGNPPVYAAQFAEVEVDTRTGVVEVVRFAAAHDVGVAINPTNVEGQIEGALHQGVGYAITEEYRLDEKTGQPLQRDFRDYKLLTAVDMPEIDSIVVEAACNTGPFGAKSIGESGLVATAAAIGNAIYDALGIRLREIPFNAEMVLRALHEGEGIDRVSSIHGGNKANLK